jgi:hypothetical protein
VPRSPSKPEFWPGAVALLCCACSIIGVKRPPADKGEVPECTSSYTLPLLDFASAVLSGSGAVLLHGQASSERDEPDGGSSGEFRALAWTATGLAVVFIASGAYGSRQVARCRSVQASAGVLPAEGPNPNWQEESRPRKGSLGGSCVKDADCSEDLVCDEPMRTCIELPPPPSSDTPSPPVDAGPGASP